MANPARQWPTRSLPSASSGSNPNWRPCRLTTSARSNEPSASNSASQPRKPAWCRAVFLRGHLVLGACGLLHLPRQTRGVLMRALAEIAAQAGGQRYGRISALVAQPVGGCQRLAPLLVLLFAYQVQLLVALGPGRNVHAQR